MTDAFICENKICRHLIVYDMKYIRVVAENGEIPICSYCNKKMKYSYSLLNDIVYINERRLK